MRAEVKQDTEFHLKLKDKTSTKSAREKGRRKEKIVTAVKFLANDFNQCRIKLNFLYVWLDKS